MSAPTWCRLIGLLSLLTFSDFASSPLSVHSQTGGAAGSGGLSPGGNQGTPTKLRGSKAGSSKPDTQPSGMPGAPRDQTQALEERLRGGQLEQPIAQDQISNRLEQLHGRSPNGATGGSTTEPSMK